MWHIVSLWRPRLRPNPFRLVNFVWPTRTRQSCAPLPGGGSVVGVASFPLCDISRGIRLALLDIRLYPHTSRTTATNDNNGTHIKTGQDKTRQDKRNVKRRHGMDDHDASDGGLYNCQTGAPLFPGDGKPTVWFLRDTGTKSVVDVRASLKPCVTTRRRRRGTVLSQGQASHLDVLA